MTTTFGWTIPLTPFGLQCVTEVCLLCYSFSLSVFSCLSQNSKDPYAVDLCKSVVKLWRTVCSGNGKISLENERCYCWGKNSNPICTFLFYPFKRSLSGKCKMYRHHLVWFCFPPTFKVMRICEMSEFKSISIYPVLAC